MANDSRQSREIALRVINAYDARIIRAYSHVRFIILRQRFMEEIGQYLPERGTVLDVGCGFGLFALFFAIRYPRIHVKGVDLDANRIAHARRAAERLGVTNVTFSVGDVAHLSVEEQLAGAYMLDIVHHVDRPAATRLIGEIAARLEPEARLLVKDVSDKPWPKMAFTWLLDKLMSLRAPIDYWSPAELAEMLRKQGLRVYRHAMVDVLPYPHVLFIAQRPGRAD